MWIKQFGQHCRYEFATGIEPGELIYEIQHATIGGDDPNDWLR